MNIIKENLLKGCFELGIEIQADQIEQFEKYAFLLKDWNKRVNLTAILEPQAIAIKHFVDSVALLAKVPITYGARIVDVGTGAGFPGIPLKIMRPDVSVFLLDSLQKRVHFLNHVIGELSLQAISAYHGRAEEVGQNKEYREQFDLAVSRAVSSLNVLAELCLPLLHVGGVFIPLKGPQLEDELRDAKQALKLLGGVVSEFTSYTLPISGDQRSIIVIEKTAQTPVKFPRRPGVPDKQPL